MRPILLIMWTAFQSFILRDNNNNNSDYEHDDDVDRQRYFYLYFNLFSTLFLYSAEESWKTVRILLRKWLPVFNKSLHCEFRANAPKKSENILQVRKCSLHPQCIFIDK